MKRRTLLIALLAAACAAPAGAQDTVPSGRVFQTGEVLRYKVKWTIVRLGTVTIRTVHDSSCHGPDDIKLVMTVESNPDLRFIWIREYNECVIDQPTFDPRFFHGRHRNGEACTEILHQVDREIHATYYTVLDRVAGSVISKDTLSGVEHFVEGPSLFFIARCLSLRNGSRSVPTLVGGRVSPTDLTFGGATEMIEIGALDTPVRTRRFTGEAHWQGGTEAGLGGAFTGWVSDDDAAVPVVAELKVILGSIRLELESWTRPGWVPPTGQLISRRMP